MLFLNNSFSSDDIELNGAEKKNEKLLKYNKHIFGTSLFEVPLVFLFLIKFVVFL